MQVNWPTKKIIELCDFERGTEPGSKYYNREGEGASFIRVGNIAARIQEQIYTTSENIKLCNENDILIAMDGSPGVVIKGVKGAYSSGIRKVILKRPEKLLYDFIYYVLQANFVQKVIQEYTAGVTIKHASKSLEYIKIPLPPLSEQKKIVYVLDSVKSAVEVQERIIEKTKELKRALMYKLFREGTRGAKLKKTEIGEIPENWEVVPFGEITNFKNGINFSKEQKGTIGILTIDVLNMYPEKIELDLKGLYRVNGNFSEDYLLKNRDILFVRSSLKPEGVGWASMFRECNEPVTYCGFIIRARFKKENYLPEFYTFLLRTQRYKNFIIGSKGTVGITNVSQDILKNLKIPVPSFSEQREIAEILQTVDQKIEIEQKKKALYGELFKTMLNNLMTGEIRVDNLKICQSN